ncbi:hypothetical protein M5689_024423 [Euphorbia peplus]|nr:hypothetical protein M5689_024423 [Euphorbia peplus]
MWPPKKRRRKMRRTKLKDTQKERDEAFELVKARDEIIKEFTLQVTEKMKEAKDIDEASAPSHILFWGADAFGFFSELSLPRISPLAGSYSIRGGFYEV